MIIINIVNIKCILFNTILILSTYYRMCLANCLCLLQGPPGPPGTGMPPGGRGRGRGPGNWGPPGGEMTFSIPAHKCGLVIGRGGENVKSINQQTGAFVEISRQPPPNGDPNFKLFTIRGNPQQIDHAKQLIEDKIEVEDGPSVARVCEREKSNQMINTRFCLFLRLGSSVSCRSRSRWSRSSWPNGSIQPKSVSARTSRSPTTVSTRSLLKCY